METSQNFWNDLGECYVVWELRMYGSVVHVHAVGHAIQAWPF